VFGEMAWAERSLIFCVVAAVCSHGSGCSRPRVVSLLVAADASVRSQPNWQKRITNRVAEVSELYRGMGIQWRVARFAQWDPPSGQGLDELRKEFRKREPATDADIRIAFLKHPSDTGQPSGVVAFCRTVVLSDEPAAGEDRNVALLAHALAHLFGARDAPGDNDHARFVPDPAVSALVRRFRNFDFRKGPADSKEVLEYYAEDSGATGKRALARAHTGVGILLWADADSQAALRHFEEAIREDSEDPAAHYHRGILLLEGRRQSEAANEFRAAMRQDSGNAELHNELGLALAQDGKIDAAIEEFRLAIKLAPEDARAFNNLGAALARQFGNIDPAVSAFEEALRLQPYSSEAQRNLANALNLRAKYDRDIDTMAVLAKKNPADLLARYNSGVALLRRGRFTEAGSEFQAALRLNADFAQAHADYAIVLHQQGRHREAWDEMERARRLGAHPPEQLVESVKARLSSTPATRSGTFGAK
jgi:Flp pilus assembly protein TadD